MSKWRVNLNKPKGQSLIVLNEISGPLGYDVTYQIDNEDTSVNMTVEMQLAAKQRHAMNIAYGPGKSLLSTAFMLWMSGSSIQIFSIMMTAMALFNPIKALAAINEPFRQFEKEEGVDLKIPKLIFAALQVLSLGVALYKCSTMGLLPLTAADWIEYLPKVSYLELAALPVNGLNDFIYK